MPRGLFLIVYKSRLFPAHWSLWIPGLADPAIGKRMHVTGDVHSGFEHEFVRNDDLRSETRRHVVILIGEVEDCYVNDDGTMDLMGGEERDKTPRDRVEEIALEVPAPGPSMNSASRNSAPTGRVRTSNCQDWLVEFAAELVKRDILPLSANSVMDDAPKN